MRTALLVSMGLLLGALPVSADQAAVNPQATAPSRRAALSQNRRIPTRSSSTRVKR